MNGLVPIYVDSQMFQYFRQMCLKVDFVFLAFHRLILKAIRISFCTIGTNYAFYILVYANLSKNLDNFINKRLIRNVHLNIGFGGCGCILLI